MNVVAANETFWLDPTGTQKVKKVHKIGSLSPQINSKLTKKTLVSKEAKTN